MRQGKWWSDGNQWEVLRRKGRRTDVAMLALYDGRVRIHPGHVSHRPPKQACEHLPFDRAWGGPSMVNPVIRMQGKDAQGRSHMEEARRPQVKVPHVKVNSVDHTHPYGKGGCRKAERQGSAKEGRRQRTRSTEGTTDPVWKRGARGAGRGGSPARGAGTDSAAAT